MAIGDGFAARIEYHVQGCYMGLNLNIGETDACTDDIPVRTLCYTLSDVLLPWLKDFWATDVFITAITAQQIRPSRRLLYRLNLTDQGLVMSQSVAQLSPAILSLYAFDGVRLRRSTLYLSGVPEATQGGGGLTGAGVDALSGIGAALVDVLNAPLGMTGQWVAGNRSESSPIPFIAFESYRANQILGTRDERRQKPGNPP